MKKLLILPMFLSINSFAKTVINCTSKQWPSYNYSIVSTTNLEEYIFTVSRPIKDHYSCRSRWGCEHEVFHQETLIMYDIQGVMYLKGKNSRTQINMEEMDYVSYSYVTKNNSGSYRTNHIQLQCQDKL